MAEQLAIRYGIQEHYSDFDRMLQQVKPDVVHITAPPQSHLPLAKKALDAGCHILVEKPLALDHEEAAHLIDHVVRSNRKMTIGYTFYFDPIARALRTFIVSLRGRDRAILLCTHDLDEAQRIADRVVVLYKGRVAREGTTEALRAVDQPTFVATFEGEEGVAIAALARIGVTAQPASVNGTRAVRFSSGTAPQTNPAVLRALLDDGLRVLTLSREERTLEEAYFAIVSQAKQA